MISIAIFFVPKEWLNWNQIGIFFLLISLDCSPQKRVYQILEIIFYCFLKFLFFFISDNFFSFTYSLRNWFPWVFNHFPEILSLFLSLHNSWNTETFCTKINFAKLSIFRDENRFEDVTEEMRAQGEHFRRIFLS